MKMRVIFKFIGVWALVLLVFSCGSTAPTKAPTTAGSQKFTGNGGRGLTLAVLELESHDLNASQNYLPSMIQGVLVGDIVKYSAITVLDRITLDNTQRELGIAAFKDEGDFGKLKEAANVEFSLTGNITGIESGFNLQLQIRRNGESFSDRPAATYNGDFTADELVNFVGIRRASLELLTQMGVNLTGRARDEIMRPEAPAHLAAHTSLAQGIMAQRVGNTIETMIRFFEANSYDASFEEALERVENLSSTIRSGNIGDNFRNDIAWRDAWVRINNDAIRFMQANLPVVARVIYNPELTQDNIDYGNRTTEYIFYAQIVDSPEYPEAYLKVMDDLNTGLEATGRNNVWNINKLTPQNVWNPGSNNVRIQIRGELLNNDDKVIGRCSRDNTSRAGDSVFGETRITTVGHADNTGKPAEEDHPFKMSFNVAADDVTDGLKIRLTATGTDNTRTYPVQTYTIAEYKALLAELGGLPAMQKAEVFLNPQRARRDSDRKQLTVELAQNHNERNFHLSYRPGIAEDEGLIVRLKQDEFFDTTNYQFPVSVAVFAFDASFGGILRIVDMDPGKKEQLSKLSGNNASDFTLLVVPKGWFGRNGIRAGDSLIR